VRPIGLVAALIGIAAAIHADPPPALIGSTEDGRLLLFRADNPEATRTVHPSGLSGRLVGIDLRPADDFQQGHLPGARSIPIRELRRRGGLLPRGRVILYCACPKEELEAAYRFLTDLGLEQVEGLEGGFPGWVSRGYPLER